MIGTPPETRRDDDPLSEGEGLRTSPVRVFRYGSVAIALHWLIAAAIMIMIATGLWMTRAINVPETQAQAFSTYQFHKSLGLSILILSAIRLIWRLLHRPPALPSHMSRWERRAARGAHGFFYGLMIALPVTGWMYTSAGWNSNLSAPFQIPTIWFGIFEWPHLPFVASAPEPMRALVADTALTGHELLAWGCVVLIFLHVAAALKHHFIDRDEVLVSMLPWFRTIARVPQKDIE
jgi:cytochrome b561